MRLVEHIASFSGTITSEDVQAAIRVLEGKLEDLELASRTNGFTPEFIKFLESGDISHLAPDGSMSRQMYDATKTYVFSVIEHIAGRTAVCRYLSGKHFMGVIPQDSDLDKTITRGPCIVIHEKGQLKGWLSLTKDQLASLGGIFNHVAARSKS